MSIEFPQDFKRQFEGSLDIDMVFSGTSNRTDYLTSLRRYAGQIVSDNETSKAYILNSSKDTWIEISTEEGSCSSVLKLNTDITDDTSNVDGGMEVKRLDDDSIDARSIYDINMYTQQIKIGPEEVDIEDATESHTVAVSGNINIFTTGIQKVGTGCANFGQDWSYSTYLSCPDSDDWYLGSDDFTIEGYFLNLASIWMPVTVYSPICGQYVDDNNYWFIAVDIGKDIFQIYAKSGGTTVVDIQGNTPPFDYGTFYHFSVNRKNNTYYMFVDGTEVSSYTLNSTGSLPNLSTDLTIARVENDTSEYTFKYGGYMDEFVFSKGVCRRDSNFTPPTAPSEEDTYTKLLIHFDWPHPDIVAGDFIQLKDCEDPLNNGYYRVLYTIALTTLVVNYTDNPLLASQSIRAGTVAKDVGSKVFWDESEELWKCGTKENLSQISRIYKHDNEVESNTWSIDHNLETEYVMVQCFNTSGQIIVPQIVYNTENNTTLTFVSGQTGNAVIVG